MKRKTFHIALRIATLFVMTLTSTGFTTIVKYCTMTESSTCCCEETHNDAATSADGVAISSPDASCLVQTIAGGRNEITATMHADESSQLPVLEVIPFCSDAIGAAAPVRALSFLQTDDIAPPGVDIYIRVNSFLI